MTPTPDDSRLPLRSAKVFDRGSPTPAGSRLPTEFARNTALSIVAEFATAGSAASTLSRWKRVPG